MSNKRDPGIVCPNCGGHDMPVVDSRPGNGYVRRRRKCAGGCANVRITTAEFTAPNSDTAYPATLMREISALPLDRQTLVRQLIRELAT
jgi:transcriptional regulator NrdR family protein